MRRLLSSLLLLCAASGLRAQLTIQTASLPDGIVWTAYSQTLTATGGTLPYAWSISAGLPPNCLTISTVGTISGTPCAPGVFNFTARVADGVGASATRALSITIGQPLNVQNLELSPGIVKIPYAGTTLAGTGGTGPYTFAKLSATDAPGIAYDAPTGRLSGTPTAVGAYAYTFRVTDALGATADRAYTLAIEPPGESGQWNRVANTNGGIYTVQLSPNFATDSTVFAMSATGALYRATDNGANFSTPNPQASWPTYGAFALSPVYDGLNLATADARTIVRKDAQASRVWKSTDHGATYALANSGLPAEADYHMAIAFSPNFVTDRTLYTTVSSTATSAQLYRTTNAGATWALRGTIATACPTTCANVLDLQASRDAAGNLVLFAISSYASGYALHRSGDGGATWQRVDTVTGYTDYIAISPNFASDRTVVYTSNYYSQIRISTDGGMTFFDGGRSLWRFGGCRFEARPGQNPRLWLIEQSGGAAVYSDDYGRSLVRMPGRRHRVDYSYGNGVAAGTDPGGAPTLYLADQMGLEWSRDHGRIMAPRDNGIHTHYPFRLSSSGAALVTGGDGYWMLSENAAQSLMLRMNDAVMFGYPIQSVSLSRNYASDGTIFLANYAGVFRSLNRGATFSELSTGLPATFSGGAVAAISPDYTPGAGVVFATAGSGGPLYRSGDGGANFAAVAALTGCFPTTVSVSDFQFSPAFATDNTVFLLNNFDSRLCVSTDRGITWAQVGAAPVYAFSLSPLYDHAGANGTVQKTLYVSSGTTIRRSTDGGVTRTTVHTAAGTVSMIALSPAYALDGMILATGAGTRGFYRSDTFGASFSEVLGTSLSYRALYGFAFGPGFDGRNSSNSPMYASVSGDGLYRSTDGGRSFTPVATQGSVSFLADSLRSIASDGGRVVYAGTENQGIFRSLDEGGSFSGFSAGLSAGLKVNALHVPDLAPTSPIAAVEGAGLWRLSGSIWGQVASANSGTFTQLVTDGTRLYAARVDGTSLVSVNNGASWTALSAAQPDLAAMDYNAASSFTFRADPAGRRKGPLMGAAVTASLWGVSQTAGPRYSTDNGANWTPAPGGNDYTLPSGQSWKTVGALGIDAASGGRVVVAGTSTGLYLSRDGGAIWRTVSGTGSGLEASSKNFSATLSTPTAFGTTDILVGVTGATTGGVYLSGDGGEHWTQVNQGFDPAQLSISTLVKTSCAGCPVQYYSGSFGGGLYTRTIAVVAPPAFPAANYACWGSTVCACATAPGSGSITGGQPFKMCGSNFQNGLVVEFDGIAASGCTQSGGTTITCAGTPAHVAGYASVRVRNPDTRVGFLPAPYQFTGSSARVVNSLRVAKSGGAGVISWDCSLANCPVSNRARMYRAQNAGFTLYLENYDGGSGGTQTGGCTPAPGNNSCYQQTGVASNGQSYFWIVD